jgi:putative multiple sugar transport system substrate-binding protein
LEEIMKKKLIALLAVLALLLTLVAACGPKQDVEVGIVLPTKDEPRWLQDQAQFEKLLGDAGFTSSVLFSQGSPATEKTNVETLINQGIKVLIICAHDGDAAAASAEAARDAGVTVIAYDRLITGTDAVDYYVTFDSVEVGKAQGQYLIDTRKQDGEPLYLYAGADTDNNAFLFFQGAWEVLQPEIAAGNFVIANSSEAEALASKKDLERDEIAKIIGQVTTNWDFNVAKSKAEANLSAVGDDLKGDVAILAPNDGTARAIADTFESDAAVTSYEISGQDAEKASVQYIIDGKQSMTVFKDTRILASDSVDLAKKILGGEKPSTDATYNNGKIDVPSIQTEVIVVTKDKVKPVLIDSGYYEAGDFTGLD